jgi:hypothetical protein
MPIKLWVDGKVDIDVPEWKQLADEQDDDEIEPDLIREACALGMWTWGGSRLRSPCIIYMILYAGRRVESAAAMEPCCARQDGKRKEGNQNPGPVGGDDT